MSGCRFVTSPSVVGLGLWFRLHLFLIIAYFNRHFRFLETATLRIFILQCCGLFIWLSSPVYKGSLMYPKLRNMAYEVFSASKGSILYILFLNVIDTICTRKFSSGPRTRHTPSFMRHFYHTRTPRNIFLHDLYRLKNDMHLLTDY